MNQMSPAEALSLLDQVTETQAHPHLKKRDQFNTILALEVLKAECQKVEQLTTDKETAESAVVAADAANKALTEENSALKTRLNELVPTDP